MDAIVDETKKEKADYPGYDSATFAKKKFSLRWLVERVLVANQLCVVGGPKKCLKTSIALDLAAR